MATRSQGRHYENRKRQAADSGEGGRTRNNLYVYGNTVRQLDVREAIHERPKRERYNAARKNRERETHMNSANVLFLAVALVVSGIVLISYIRLQSDITNSINHIASLESELNTLRLSNDEEYSRIESSVNLEEIKRIAIEELGMTYASEGQVVEYSSEGSDYVRQMADIPN